MTVAEWPAVEKDPKKVWDPKWTMEDPQDSNSGFPIVGWWLNLNITRIEGRATLHSRLLDDGSTYITKKEVRR